MLRNKNNDFHIYETPAFIMMTSDDFWNIMSEVACIDCFCILYDG